MSITPTQQAENRLRALEPKLALVETRLNGIDSQLPVIEADSQSAAPQRSALVGYGFNAIRPELDGIGIHARYDKAFAGVLKSYGPSVEHEAREISVAEGLGYTDGMGVITGEGTIASLTTEKVYVYLECEVAGNIGKPPDCFHMTNEYPVPSVTIKTSSTPPKQQCIALGDGVNLYVHLIGIGHWTTEGVGGFTRWEQRSWGAVFVPNFSLEAHFDTVQPPPPDCGTKEYIWEGGLSAYYAMPNCLLEEEPPP
jgi:hypothetical protein